MPNRAFLLGSSWPASVALHVGNEQHVGTVDVQLELVRHILAQD